MKKIFSGLFFRLIKGYEIWPLIALLIASSFVFEWYLTIDQDFLSLYRSEGKICVEGYDWSVDVSSDNVRQFRFENSGISAYDFYRRECEPVLNGPDNSLPFSYEDDEMLFFCLSISELIILPAILIIIFIPVFFGRMYSDGTLKNYIACGHSKGSIYLSSLLFSFVLDLVMVLINFLVFAGFWLYYAWKPPVYLPVVLALFASSIMLLFTVTSICLAVLFISSSKIITFIVSVAVEAILIFTAFMILLPVNAILESQEIYPVESKEFAEYRELFIKNEEEGLYDSPFYERFNLSDFSIDLFHDGKEVKIEYDCALPPASRYALLAVIYLNPAMIHQMMLSYEEFYIPPYMMCRDGLIAINIASNIFWITVISGVTVIVLRKREIQC